MPCIASDFKRELRPPFRFPLPSETLVTGDAVPGGWVKKFSAGTRPAENDFILFFRHWRKNLGSRRFPLAPLSRMMRGRWKYQWRLLPLFFRMKVSLN